MQYNPKLPSNRMIFEVRRRRELYADFASRLEPVMEAYGLSEAEKDAFRRQDLVVLRDLGVHPYFLPQITRLLHGSANNDSTSAAARTFRRMMVERD